MKILLQFSLIVLLFSGSVLGKSNYQISLITCEQGDASYATFGHTAIRVIDQTNNTDLVYNFGMFRFDVDNFAWKFIMGGLQYWLGVHRTELFLKMYIYENRTVWEQKLMLDNSHAQRLADTLQYIYKPENRYYYYHFLEQNCTTEARDVLLAMLNKEVTVEEQPTNETYRGILDKYLQNKPWTQLGIHIIMGTNVDRKINSFEYLSLPETLMEGFEQLHYKYPEIVGTQETIFQADKTTSANNKLIAPLTIFAILLGIRILLKFKLIDYLLWLTISIISLIIITVWIYSAHMELQSNWNILWASPTYLLLIITSLARWKQISKAIAVSNIAFIAGYIIILLAGTQAISQAIWPLLVLLTLTNLQVIYPKLSIWTKKAK